MKSKGFSLKKQGEAFLQFIQVPGRNVAAVRPLMLRPQLQFDPILCVM